MNLVQVGKTPVELYDLSADIAERKTLAESKSDVAAGLQKELNALHATLVEPKWEPLDAPMKKEPRQPEDE